MTDLFAETLSPPPEPPATPITLTTAPGTPAPASDFDPFTAAPAAAQEEAAPPLPEIPVGTVVRERATGRFGIVIAKGDLPGQGRHAIVVGFLAGVTHPALTDTFDVVGG